MQDRTANLLGALGLAVADRIAEIALEVLDRAGETPAALVVIGYGLGPSNDQLRRILGLSHPGMVRLVDRLVADELVERQVGRDRRAVALFLTPKGHEARETLLAGRVRQDGVNSAVATGHRQAAFDVMCKGWISSSIMV
jgi:DNA-binding MarR family transcriptional regulator